MWPGQNARLFLTAALLLVATTPALAGVDFTTRNSYYEISDFIDSRRKLWQAIGMWGPRSKIHGSAIGTARQRIRYDRSVIRSGKRCSISNVNVTVSVVLTLPKWSNRDKASPYLQRYFDCVSRTVTVHEKRHAQISYETGQRLDAALHSELQYVPCEGFKRRESALVRQIYQHGRMRQRAFDRADYAKPRYQKCHRVAKKRRSKQRHVDVRDQKRRSISETLPTKKTAEKDTDTSKALADVREATLRFMTGLAGFVALGAVLFGLFAVLMRWAQRKERLNEMQEMAANRSPVARPSSGKTTGEKRTQNGGGFGKRRG